MKIPLHYSLAVARKVINKVNITAKIAKECSVESWSNGREQGLCISVCYGDIDKWKKIMVAQHRSSDSIMVICGSYRHFDMQTNQPSQELWDTPKARTHFDYNDVDGAVSFIEQKIKED